LRYNISQELVLARIEFEQNGLTAKIKKGEWIYPSGEKAPLKSVLNRLTGYGQIWSNAPPDHRFCKKYMGFFRQIRGCCRCYKRDWKKYHDFNLVLYNYAPKSKAVIDYNNIVKKYFPKFFN
jgi:hypothetical protein